jgi:type I restriction enzyme, S subunit
MNIQSDTALTPKLRFPEFSGEWEEKKLGELCKFTQGVQVPFSEQLTQYEDGTIRYLYIRDFFTDDFPYYVKDQYPSKVIHNDEIMMVNTGNTSGKAFMGATGVLSNNAFKVSFDKAKVSNFFLFQRITSNAIQRKIKSFFNAGGQPHLGHNNIAAITIGFTSLQEQQKIATFLTSVDNKIAQLSKKQELLEKYKKGLMQKIFSQAIRLKADDGSDFPNWEEKKLGDILDYEQPTNYIVESTEYDDSFDTPVLTAGKTFILGYSNETHSIFNKLPVIIFDDFTTANKYVDFPFKVKSSAMKILTTKNDFINTRLIFEFIQMLHFPIGEHKRYWISEYQDLKIPFPSFKEQSKIANFLSYIDNKIEQVEKQLDETKQFKKALLQQMFV